MEKVNVKIGSKKDAELFVHILCRALKEKPKAALEKKLLKDNLYNKRTRDYCNNIRTRYFVEIEGDHLFESNDPEKLMDGVIPSYIKKNRRDIDYCFEARIVYREPRNKTVLYKIKDNIGLMLIKQEYFSPIIKMGQIVSVLDKQYLYNRSLKQWETANMISQCFIKGKDGIIIDCGNENPQKVKNTFIRSLARLYARSSCTEYGGTNSKYDDYLRDYVEKRICKPVIEGNKIYCNIWDPSSGGSMVYTDYAEGKGIVVDHYGFDRLTTFEHAFKSFYSRSGCIDFVAHVSTGKRGYVDTFEIFYSEKGEVNKINRTSWAKSYKF